MKKKLEAELISIAHRILKIKNKSDIVSLHQEVQKLYETLSVLRFVEDNFGDVKPTIGIDQVNQKIADIYDEESQQKDLPSSVVPEINEDENLETNDVDSDVEDDKAVAEENTESEESIVDEQEEVAIESESRQEELSEPIDEDEFSNEDQESDNQIISEDEVYDDVTASEDSEEILTQVAAETVNEKENSEFSAEAEETKSVFIPSFELAFDPKVDDELAPTDPVTPQFTFDDLLGKDYSDPVFVKAEDVSAESAVAEEKIVPIQPRTEAIYEVAADREKKNFSVNDRLSKGITIGLNDRIAFMKHLFGNSSEDYNRVLSQLLTFDTFDEAENFISDMVKPDYNNWEGKDEYSQRFMEIVERRFS